MDDLVSAVNKELLSIPLWFDWGQAVPPQHIRPLPPFNPTLVRLGARDLPTSPSRIRLSIPLWFDWGTARLLAVGERPPPFNPTLVRLGDHPVHVAEDVGGAFNPTLVRLGAEGYTLRPLVHYYLSIPLWFDWGRHLPAGPCVVSRRFQSHSGSIGGRVKTLADELVTPFNPTLVRLGAVKSCCRHRPPADLSIPLWFDWGMDICSA